MDPTKRFSSRVNNYARFRPDYPKEVLTWLARRCSLTIGSVVADVGSGTGIFSRLLLRDGYTVYGIEPNDAMRAEGERALARVSNFRSCAGTAEATGLASSSVDLVVAAQAAHWFDIPKAKVEFRRILKTDGFAALLWNVRRTESTPFLRDYEALLTRRGVDYQEVNARQGDEAWMREFFAPGGYEPLRLDHSQTFDEQGFIGRALSSSYTPEPGQPGYELLIRELRELFERHQRGELVTFEYDTCVYLGRP